MRNVTCFAASIAVILAARSALAAQYEVGAGKQYTSPCKLFAAVQLSPGDVVVVDAGTYNDACQITQSGTAAAPLVMRGAAGPRPMFDPTGIDLSGAGSVPRAVFQFTGASHWRVSHLELKNASGSSGNGAAFRSTAGSDDVVIADMSIHDCQDGMQSDGAGTLVIQSSDIFHNGANDGYTHNLYLDNDTVRLIGNYIHDSIGGQNVKLRVHYAEVLYNLIANAGNYEIDLIQGPPLTDQPNSNVVLIGNVVLRNPNGANSGQTIVFGSDNPAQPGRNGSFYAFNNTFVMTNASNKLVHAIAPAAGSKIHFLNNILHATVSGTAIAYDAATATLFDGTNNWVTTGIAAPAGLAGTVAGADPGFVSATDAHLLASSPARGKGVGTLSYADGSGVAQNGVPQQEFSNAGGSIGVIGRLASSTPDLGAFEFGTPDGGADGGAGGVDASAPDGGDDGGGPVTTRPDSGTAGDGGTNGAVPGTSGCGCFAGGGGAGEAASLVAFGALVCAFLRRRRASA